MKQLFSELIKPIVQPVQAEGETTDAVAQPTFFTDIDFSDTNTGGNGGNNGGGNSNGEGSISILTDATSFVVGGEFTVEIKVDSNETEIGSYTIKIEYNPEMLTVTDSNTEVTGTQVEFTDTVFNEVQNEVNLTSGTVSLKGEIGSPTAIDMIIGKVKFKSLKEGSVEIKVIKAESAMVDDTSANILQNTNGLAVTIGDTVGQPGEIIDDPLLPNTPGGDVKKLPDSDLPFAGLLYMILGIVLIIGGIQAKRLARKRNIE